MSQKGFNVSWTLIIALLLIFGPFAHLSPLKNSEDCISMQIWLLLLSIRSCMIVGLAPKVALTGVSLLFKTGIIRADVKRVDSKNMGEGE